jgi:TubC N-terminal docking domain
MRATTLVNMLRAQGWGFAIDGDQVRIRRPKGALTEALRQALTAEKGAIIQILAAEQQRAPVPPQADDIVALKVWSEILEEALWVIADGVPIDEYLDEGKVFTHHEVRVLRAHGRGVKAWAPLDAEMEG